MIATWQLFWEYLKSASLPNLAEVKQKRKRWEFPERLGRRFGEFDQNGNENESQSGGQNIHHDTP
jgi:hypothetical protein